MYCYKEHHFKFHSMYLNNESCYRFQIEKNYKVVCISDYSFKSKEEAIEGAKTAINMLSDFPISNKENALLSRQRAQPIQKAL